MLGAESICYAVRHCTQPSFTMKTSAGNVYLVTAPSGAGKSSLVNALLQRDPGLTLSISCTTRAPRPGEKDGVHYRFVSDEVFEVMRADDELLEWAQVHDHFYGTPKTPMLQAMEAGQDVILEIDWQGAHQVRQSLSGVTGIFILPPSMDALQTRLRNRAQDSDEVIARRMANAAEEISHAPEFEYVIVNEEFDVALEQLEHIIQAQRLTQARQALAHKELFAALGIG